MENNFNDLKNDHSRDLNIQKSIKSDEEIYDENNESHNDLKIQENNNFVNLNELNLKLRALCI